MYLSKQKLVFISCSVFRNAIARSFHVAVAGAASDLGQTVSMMLRTEPTITKLSVHDTLSHNKGVILDLSHIPAASALEGYSGEENLIKALKGASLVLAVGGISDMPGVSKTALFNRNIDFVKQFTMEVAKLSPMPFVGIATEPINSTVPMAAELLRQHGNYEPKKLFGITGVDSLRAIAMYATLHSLNPYECFVPVIGGHSNKTIIPLLSQARPERIMTEKQVRKFTEKLQNSDQIVTNMKNGWGPSLSVACSVLQFTRGIINAMDGKLTKLNVFLENNDFGTSFIQGLVYINEEGTSEVARYTGLSAYECELLEASCKYLRKEVSEGTKVLEND